MDLKSKTGESIGPYREEVTPERVEKFCRVIGASGLRDYVPPTYLTTCRRGEFDLFEKYGIALSQLLHAEQEYSYESLVRVGDVLEFKTSLSRVLEKQGGSGVLRFVNLTTEFVALRGPARVRIGSAVTTVVVRS